MFKMCKKFFIFIIAILVLTALPGEAAKKTVAVMPIDSNSKMVQNNSETVTYKLVAENMVNQLIIALHNSNAYTVVEREQLNHALTEIGFQMGGAVDQSQSIAAGKMLGVQYSVLGKVTLAEVINNEDKNTIEAIKKLANKSKDDENEYEDEESKSKDNVSDLLDVLNDGQDDNFEGRIAVDIKFLNNETGEIVLATEISGTQTGTTGANALRAACKAASEDFLSQIIKQAPFSAIVLDVEGDVVYIDKGTESALRKGEILNVSKEGIPIKNMEGKIIAVKTMALGKLEVQEVNEGYSICKIIEKTASEEIKRGCIAKRVSN